MIKYSGTFEYEAEFVSESFRDSEILLNGTDRQRRYGNKERLIGHNPTIRFWRKRVALFTAEKSGSSVRKASFPVGEAVSLCAQPGDNLYIVRSGAGAAALSVFREDALVVAIGAVRDVPLGRDLQIVAAPRATSDFLRPLPDTWLEVKVGSEHRIMRTGDVAALGGYQIYIESCWQQGIPGIEECVSICTADNAALKTAAMRSARLLANGSMKLTHWDSSKHSIDLWPKNFQR